MTSDDLHAVRDALRAAKTDFGILRGTLVPFNERRQEFWCKVCRYRDPLGTDGTKLHDDNCPLLALLNSFAALEVALSSDAVARSDGHANASQRATESPVWEASGSVGEGAQGGGMTPEDIHAVRALIAKWEKAKAAQDREHPRYASDRDQCIVDLKALLAALEARHQQATASID